MMIFAHSENQEVSGTRISIFPCPVLSMSSGLGQVFSLPHQIIILEVTFS